MAEATIQIDPQTGDIVKLAGFYQGLTEVAFYQMVDHPNIVKVKAIDWDPESKFQLRIRMKRYKTLNEISVNLDQLVREMIDALAYLEANDILHNDIKPDNILYDPETDRYMLIDFGVSTKFTQCHSERTGTPTTVPPEVIYKDLQRQIRLERRYNPNLQTSIPPIEDTMDSRSDIFSLGATLYILITGHTWFGKIFEGRHVYRISDNPEDLLRDVLSQEYLSELTGQWKDLISLMMRPYPKDRPDALQLARDFKIDKPYTMVKIPVTQIPKWSSEQIASIPVELHTIQSVCFTKGEFSEKNAYRLAMTFFSLKDVDPLKIPSYLYVALVISHLICSRGDYGNYGAFQEYLRMWEEGLYDPRNFYNVFSADWSKMNINFIPEEIAIEMVSALDFRTLFEF